MILKNIGLIHFIGIGGIGMSGIAEILKKLNYQIQGSDIVNNYNTQRLKNQNIPIFIGHNNKNIINAKLVVISSAIKSNNPELIAAYNNNIPVITRNDMLIELMRNKKNIVVAGSHGKTTTTSMIASLLDAGNINPTVIAGGIINNYNTKNYFCQSRQNQPK